MSDILLNEEFIEEVVENDMIVRDYYHKEDPGGRLGGLISLSDTLSVDEKVTLENVKMLVRLAFVIGFVEAGKDIYTRMSLESTELSNSANEYVSMFVRDRLNDLGIDDNVLTRILQGDQEEESYHIEIEGGDYDRS